MSLEIEEVSFRIKVLVLSDIIKFFQRKHSRCDEPDTKEEILEGILQDHRIDDPGENRSRSTSFFIPSHFLPHCSDRFGSLSWFFAYLFCVLIVWYSLVARMLTDHEDNYCNLKLTVFRGNSRTVKTNIKLLKECIEILWKWQRKNVLHFCIDSFFIYISFRIRESEKSEDSQHPCIAGQQETILIIVLTIGVVTEPVDNMTSGASHLTCLRGGRERYYEATSTKPLHWQAS